jgi:hypothetical protein
VFCRVQDGKNSRIRLCILMIKKVQQQCPCYRSLILSP